MKRAVPLVKRGLNTLSLGFSVAALSACSELVVTSADDAPALPEAQTSNIKEKAPKTAAKVRDVPAPTAFAATDKAIWDGRPSLGAIWVAHPDAPQAERVKILNTKTGKAVAGALFTRKTRAAGPPIQLSSQAALALGVGPGQTATIKITAIRPSDDLPVQAPLKMAQSDIWGTPDAEPQTEPQEDTELLLAAQNAPSVVPDNPLFDAGLPMGTYVTKDAALLVQARLSQAGVRSEIREAYLDELIIYKVFAEQAESKVMVAELDAPQISKAQAQFDITELDLSLPGLGDPAIAFAAPSPHSKPLQPADPVVPTRFALVEAIVTAQIKAPDAAANFTQTATVSTRLPVTAPPPRAKLAALLSQTTDADAPAKRLDRATVNSLQLATNTLNTKSEGAFDAPRVATPATRPTPTTNAHAVQLAAASAQHPEIPRKPSFGKPTIRPTVHVERPNTPLVPEARGHQRAAFEALPRPVTGAPELRTATTTPTSPTRQRARSAVVLQAHLEDLSLKPTTVDVVYDLKHAKIDQPRFDVAAHLAQPLANASVLPRLPKQKSSVTLLASIEPYRPASVVAAALTTPTLLETSKPGQVPQRLLADPGFNALPSIGLAPKRPVPRKTGVFATATATGSTLRPTFQLGTIRDATSLDIFSAPKEAGLAEIPNFKVFENGQGMAGQALLDLDSFELGPQD